MEIILSKFGEVIATDEKSQEIYDELKKSLDKGNSIVIDAKNVTISTKSARFIFGRLYKEMKGLFNDRITFVNNSSLFTFSVNEGIATEVNN
jgi:hypothetical protein